MNQCRKQRDYEGLFPQSAGIFKGEHYFDIEGVPGSIPGTPTIQIKHLAANYEALQRFNEPEVAL